MARSRGSKAAGAEDAWWYLDQLFDYTNQLLERTEQRANFLLISNSVVGASYFSILSFFAEDNNQILAGLTSGSNSLNEASALDTAVIALLFMPGLALSASILLSVYTVLPIIMRADIKLNQSFISSMTSDEYHSFLDGRPQSELRRDFVDEVHILSCILEVKSKRVGRAARAFVIAMATIPTVLGCYIAVLLLG